MRSSRTSCRSGRRTDCARPGSRGEVAAQRHRRERRTRNCMRLEYEIVAVHTRTPFVIARGGASEWRRVWVRVIDQDGAEGWGEAAPNRFYGETADSVVAALEALTGVIERANGWSLDGVEREMHKTIRFNASAKSAVSAAFHDLAAKRLGVPLYR